MTILNRIAALAFLFAGTAEIAHSTETHSPSTQFATSEIARSSESDSAEVHAPVGLHLGGPAATQLDASDATLATPFGDYVLDKTDNICGLDTAKQLTNPAKVDYDDLMDATPEIRKMKKEKIDENSAKGIQLRTEAEERVRKACEKVMNDKSHCSVWKKIKRRDGKKIPDITKTVKKKITGS